MLLISRGVRTLILTLAVALGGLTARAAAGVPDVHVTVAPDGRVHPAVDAKALARVFRDAFRSSDSTAAPFGLDVSIARLAVDSARGGVEISAEVHVVISDRAGKIVSYVAGGAKLQVPAHGFHPSNLPKLEQQALEDAASALVDRVRTQLLRAAAPRDEPST